MSRIISQLLNAEEPNFSAAIADLEQRSGNPSVDVSLTAKIQGSVYRKIREMGLDPKDTTASELYAALQSMIALHNKFLSDRLGIADDQPINDQIKAIIKQIYDLPIPNKSWAIKNASAKKLLKNCPPNKLKVALKYKSLDSMLKREKIDDLLVYSRIVESEAWTKRFIKSYKKLTAGDFENRRIQLKNIDNKKLTDNFSDYIQNRRHNIVVLKEFGIVASLPLPVKKFPGLAITIMPLILHYINEVRSYSAIIKMHQMSPDFNKTLADITLHDSDNFLQLGKQQIPWKVVGRHYGRATKLNYPEIFDPHIQADDLYWRKAESVIYWLEPALKFWEDLDYVAAIYPDQIIPLSLMDNAVSYCNGLELSKHSTAYYKDSLWNELLLCYVGQDNFQQIIIQQLDSKLAKNELVEF